MSGVRGAVVAVALLASAACSGGPVLEGSVYRDAKLGWSIALPPGGEARWTRIRVEGADLALRGPAGELLSLEVHCGVPLAEPEILARGLRVGIPEAQLRDQREVTVDGRRAWAQVFDASPGPDSRSAAAGQAPEAPAVRVKTVTRVDARCVQDFVLAAPGDWAPAEAAFDAWWGSFRAAPEASGGGG